MLSELREVSEVSDLVGTIKRIEDRMNALEQGTVDRLLTRLNSIERSEDQHNEGFTETARRLSAVDVNFNRIQILVTDLAHQVHVAASHIRDIEEKNTFIDTSSIINRLETVEQIVPETRIRRLEDRTSDTTRDIAKGTDLLTVVKDRVKHVERHAAWLDKEVLGLHWYMRGSGSTKSNREEMADDKEEINKDDTEKEEDTDEKEDTYNPALARASEWINR